MKYFLGGWLVLLPGFVILIPILSWSVDILAYPWVGWTGEITDWRKPVVTFESASDNKVYLTMVFNSIDFPYRYVLDKKGDGLRILGNFRSIKIESEAGEQCKVLAYEDAESG